MKQLNGRLAVFDLDDTLGNLRVPMQRALWEESKVDVKWEDWHVYCAATHYDISDARLFEIMMERDMISQLEPHPEAKHMLERVREAGASIMILTARAWHPNGAAVTRKWLERHEFPYDELALCMVEADKYKVIQHRMPVLTVDDSPRHCIGYAESGAVDHVFCYSMPWNVRFKDTSRMKDVKFIDTLHEIEEFVAG